jgi:hypothetical protein
MNEALEADQRIEDMIEETDRKQANGENVTKKIESSIKRKGSKND